MPDESPEESAWEDVSSPALESELVHEPRDVAAELEDGRPVSSAQAQTTAHIHTK